MEEASFAKRDRLREIEKSIQRRWKENNVFASDAPSHYESGAMKSKFMATFPYPYMNGLIHLGHLFTITKAEFATAYHRLLGEDALFPFAFHCTGMPICSAAHRLQGELDGDVKVEKEVKQTVQEDLTSFHSRKSKAKAKGSASSEATAGEDKAPKTQREILVSMGIEDTEEALRPFTDPHHWVYYFSPLGKSDLEYFGLRADWRRSFITTDANPYYDAFVRWQFTHLKEGGYIEYGKRNCIYCPVARQPCADHERSVGESINLQDYTCIMMKVVDNSSLKTLVDVDLSTYDVYLVTATLRPETMFGLTNVWVKKDGEYGIYKATKENELIICSYRSARNMVYQDVLQFTEDNLGRHPISAGAVTGDYLIRNKVRINGPFTGDQELPILPMNAVDMNIGTGIVASVPSDAPHDYAALVDIQTRSKLREEVGLELSDVEWIKPIPIITVVGYGDTVDGQYIKDESEINMCAIYAYRKFGVKSQNEATQLQQAKKECYEKGFYKGRMIVGEGILTSKNVDQAKKEAAKYLIEHGKAFPYSEPNGLVKSREGGVECVVCPCAQWYLRYGSESIKANESDEPYNWKNSTLDIVKNMTTYGSAETRKQLENTIDWLKQWGCSRNVGLGTKIPWDPIYLVESLSDSTIYMAYYTIAHILQADLYGKPQEVDGRQGIPAENCDVAFFDNIFFNKPLPEDHVARTNPVYAEQLQRAKREFNYWYPVDLRVSGKDLLCNHLVMYLYNHAAMWNKRNIPDLDEEEISKRYHPQGIRANGHILVDLKKMSKSLGNFIVARDAVDSYGCDALRIGLAECGDEYADGNFSRKETPSNIPWLTSLIDSAKELMGRWETCLDADMTLTNADKIFLARFSELCHSCRMSLSFMKFRDVVITLRDMRKTYSDYSRMWDDATMKEKTTISLMYLITFVSFLAVVAPHISDYLWMDVIGATVLKATKEHDRDTTILKLSDYDFTKSIFKQTKPLIELTEEELEETSESRTHAQHQPVTASSSILSASEIKEYKALGSYIDSILSLIGKRIVVNNSKKTSSDGFTNRDKNIVLVVATKLPEWKQTVLEGLAASFDKEHKTFPKPAKDIVLGIIALNPALKSQMKKIMPYAMQLARDALSNPSVLESGHLDEEAILSEFTHYFRNSYNVASVSVKVDNANPIAEPGKPMVDIQ